jgi:hypothetical protein
VGEASFFHETTFIIAHRIEAKHMLSIKQSSMSRS